MLREQQLVLVLSNEPRLFPSANPVYRPPGQVGRGFLHHRLEIASHERQPRNHGEIPVQICVAASWPASWEQSTAHSPARPAPAARVRSSAATRRAARKRNHRGRAGATPGCCHWALAPLASYE